MVERCIVCKKYFSERLGADTNTDNDNDVDTDVDTDTDNDVEKSRKSEQRKQRDLDIRNFGSNFESCCGRALHLEPEWPWLESHRKPVALFPFHVS